MPMGRPKAELILTSDEQAQLQSLARSRSLPAALTVRARLRRHKNVAAVALASKTARMVWALLAHERKFRSDYVTA